MRIIPMSFLILAATSAGAETTCYGEGSYRVCSTVTQRADGSISITSSDTMGNSYRVESDVYTSPSGDVSIRSNDSMGNNYAVDSWSDSRGVHSRDSMGNLCSILNDGTVIGCGQ